MNDIKPIETVYKGYRFRSRLEAKWAVFFDSLGIRWIYEPEGLYINGIYYLPDFYLPESKQFFEVKGILSDIDMGKINALINAGYSVTIGYDDGAFRACDDWGTIGDKNHERELYELTNDYSLLCQCKTCGKYWFMGNAGIYTCQCCGEYDGDHHFVSVMECRIDDDGNVSEFSDTKLWDVARRARFEHGETPQI